MTPYREAHEPPSRARRVLWVTPQGRGIVAASGLVCVFALAITLGLARVESPMALVAFAIAAAAAALFEGGFVALVVEGDRLSASNGLLRRNRRSCLLTPAARIRVVTSEDATERRGPRRPASVHRVEVDVADGAFVVSAHRRSRAAEEVARWLRDLPAARSDAPL